MDGSDFGRAVNGVRYAATHRPSSDGFFIKSRFRGWRIRQSLMYGLSLFQEATHYLVPIFKTGKTLGRFFQIVT